MSAVLCSINSGYISVQISLDVVEIDPEMVKVAKKWFGCSEGERLSIFVADGIEFVRTSCQESNRIG